MSRTVISVENLSKRYLLGHKANPEGRDYVALRDVIGREVRNFGRKTLDVLRGRQIVQGDEIEEFWALKDVSFEVKEGEVVGTIGRNGAGKSTLLKILSRITNATRGRVVLSGRVSSLLEVGTGFHPELTGRENIYLNGAILGMTRREIARKFDEIVAFSGVEKFLDTPAKRYSSGMYVRLAFAVAAHLEPDILIVDEVLAVGDHEFQKKCLGKMKAITKEGRTVLFVSHNMQALRTLCDRAIVLRDGCQVFDGAPADAIDAYTGADSLTGSEWQRDAKQEISEIGFETTSVLVIGRQPSMKLICKMQLLCCRTTTPTFVAVDIKDQILAVIMQAIPCPTPFISGKPGSYSLEIEISLPPLVTGVYHVDFWIGHHYSRTADYIFNAVSFEVTQSPINERTFPHVAGHGSIVPFSKVLQFAELEHV
jgi:lipopolysaccharide transport system ATP-binding protein